MDATLDLMILELVVASLGKDQDVCLDHVDARRSGEVRDQMDVSRVRKHV
jgi:hypothetical protein